MSYQEFLNEISVSLGNKTGCKVSIVSKRVLGSNVEKTGIVIRGSSGKFITPILYLEDVYRDFSANGDMEKCMLDIIARNNVYALPSYLEQALLGDIVNWEKMSEYLYPVLINTERNIEQLTNMSHRTYLDLALCYMLKFKAGEHNATMIVDRALLQVWNVVEEELYQVAIENMKKDQYTIESMKDMIDICKKNVTSPEEIKALEELEQGELQTTEKMYILTNNEKQYGASGLLDVTMISQFAESNNADVYIIPSSIHELILMLDSASLDGKYIKKMVKEIDEKELDEWEVLSDNVYYYSRAMGKVICLH